MCNITTALVKVEMFVFNATFTPNFYDSGGHFPGSGPPQGRASERALVHLAYSRFRRLPRPCPFNLTDTWILR